MQENPEFDLHFEKVYKWLASSIAEKNSFISCIWKLNQRYLRKKIEFVNVSSQLLEGKSQCDDDQLLILIEIIIIIVFTLLNCPICVILVTFFLSVSS